MVYFLKLKRYFFISLSIFLLFFKYIDSEQIIFDFRTTNTKVDSSYDFMSTLYTNELYTNLTLGSLNQKKIPVIISQEQIAFSISNNSYNISNLNESALPQPRSYVWEKINNAILLQDYFIINSTSKNEGSKNNIIQQNITAKFLYVENQTLNYIGLSFPDLYEHNVVSIFKTLKDDKLIDNYQWCPKINKKTKYDWSDIDGQLVIGGNCHDYLPNIYELKYMAEFEMVSHGQYVEYSMKFSDLYVGDDPDKNNLYFSQVYFGVNYLTMGSLEYDTKIANLFFNDWIQKNICFVEIMNKYPDIHYYYCNIGLDKNKEFDIKTFPELCMGYSNNVFCFNYNDLFIEDPNDKNILYFIMGFKKYDPNNEYYKYFHFGLQFFSKYQLSFDPKNKRINYFGIKEKSNENKNDEENNENNKKTENNSSNIALIIILVIVAAILLLSLGMLLQKKLTKIPRKIRANELDDDNFLYEKKEKIII